MKWYKCSAHMPGQKDDYEFNEELCVFAHSGFLVCYHHGDDEPFLARAILRGGKFETREYCHYMDQETYEECSDKFQDRYWEECIVTHWAYIEWPDEVAQWELLPEEEALIEKFKKIPDDLFKE
jgi:hypothetical protein